MRIVLIFVAFIALAALAIVAYMLFGVRTAPEPEDITTIEEVAPAEPTAEEEADLPPMGDRSQPTFDVVRVEPTGNTLVAGRAEPGEQVLVLANGDVIGEAVADARGEWLLEVEAPLDEGDQEITLVAVDEHGRRLSSEQVVVVAVPERDGDQPLVVLSDGTGPSRVLQAPQGGIASGSLVLQSVDYDDEGNVIFAGQAEAGEAVRVYVGDRPVGVARANADGVWTLAPEDTIAPGLYTLRVDLLDDADGSVRERIEVPFERAAPRDVVLRGGRVVVQPGNSLWRIARAVYGEGTHYTVIYEANQDQIRDADLIYPGQLFEVPGQD